MSTRILRRIACLAFALAVTALWAAPSANADMSLELSSGGTGTILSDTTNSGVLNYTGAVGAFSLNFTTGTSSPPLAGNPGTIASLDVNTLNISSGSAGTITIILENTGYYSPYSLNTAVGSVGGTISNGGTVTASAFVDSTNAVPVLNASSPPGPLATSLRDLNFTSSGSPFSASGVANFAGAGQFSMYEELVVSFGAGGGTFSADLSNVVTSPEPSTLAIAGIGGLGLLGYGLRRRKALLGA